MFENRASSPMQNLSILSRNPSLLLRISIKMATFSIENSTENAAISMEICSNAEFIVFTDRSSLPRQVGVHAHPLCIFNTKFVVFNAEFIIFNTKFVIFNAEFIIFNTKFVIVNAEFIIFNTKFPRSDAFFPSNISIVDSNPIASSRGKVRILLAFSRVS